MVLNSIVVTAYAKAPQNTSYYENNKYIGVVLEIDKATDIIVDASPTFVTPTACNFFRRMVVGTNMCTGIPDLLNDIKNQYIAPSTNSLIVAIKTAQQRYMDIRNKETK